MNNDEMNALMLGIGIIVGNTYRVQNEAGKENMRKNLSNLLDSLSVIDACQENPELTDEIIKKAGMKRL